MRHRTTPAVRVACLISLAAFVAFALIDPLLVDDVTPVLLARGGVIGIVSCVLALTFHPAAERLAFPLAVAACVTIGGSVIVLTWLTGGGSSPYYAALMVVFFGFAALIPWPVRLAAPTVGGLLLAYDVMLVASGSAGEPGIWLVNNGVLWTTAAISVVGVVMSWSLRRQQFENAWSLAEANDRLQAHDRSKNHFFANLSHELRTPLTLALAPVEALLDEGSLTSGQRERLELVRRNGLRLLRLVDDLLELTRLEAAAVKLSQSPVDLAEALGELVDQVAELASRKSITMTLHAEDDLPRVLADPTQVERVALNVLANAVKFTGKGGSIDVFVRPVDEGVEVAVEDTGIGIAPDQLVRVFDRFHQVDGSSTRHHGGSGIGLALARELVKLHGGRISAESTEGEGTTMRFWLPCAGAPGGSADPGEQAEPPLGNDGVPLTEWHAELRRRSAYRLQAIADATERRLLPRSDRATRDATVLIVEDNPDMVRFLGSLLGSEHALLHASDGQVGLELALRERPDLIISDVMMPRMNGLEMVRRLRDDPATASTPVLMLTARGRESDRVEAREGGADAYLTKPFKPGELRAAVRGLLAKQVARLDDARRSGDRALQFLAQGVAHEILNPLGFVTNALFVLKETADTALEQAPDAQLSSELQGAYEAGRSGLKRVRAAVDELTNLAGTQQEQPARLIGVHELVGSVMQLAGPRLHGLKLRARLDTHAPVLAQPGQLERVLVHLVLNAQQATADDGEVELRCFELEDGRRAVSVTDNGPGIAADARDRIFAPYYTSKPPDQGSGIGLALARRIAQQHGGSLDLDPNRAGGARFVLALPAPEPRSAQAPQSPSQSA